MSSEITTIGNWMQELLPDFGPSQIESQIRLPIGYHYPNKSEIETVIVSTDVDYPLYIDNQSVTSEKSIPLLLTPIQAYEIALDILRSFEDKWEAYVQEEAKVQSIFDEDDDW